MHGVEHLGCEVDRSKERDKAALPFKRFCKTMEAPAAATPSPAAALAFIGLGSRANTFFLSNDQL